MLPPYELKNKKKFPVVLRGYAQSEVDEHIEYLIEKYTELYRKNDELERQIRLLTSRLEELETKEDAINKAIVGAQKLRDKIITEAESEAELITTTAKQSAARIINKFEDKIYYEKATLHAMMEQVSDFKAQMLEMYENHITLLNEIAPEEVDPEYDRSDSAYVSKIMSDIRRAANESLKEDDSQAGTDSFKSGHDAGEFAPVDEPEVKTEVKAPKFRRARRTPGGLSQKLEKIIEEETGTPAEAENDAPADSSDETEETLKELFSE